MNQNKQSGFVKWLLITISVLFLFVMLVLPLLVVITQAFKSGVAAYLKAVTDKYTVRALLLTLEATLTAVVVNTIFGLFAAWTITKFKFKGKKLLTTLIDIPVTVSPVIAGLIFILLFGRQSVLYPILKACHIKVVFAVPGIILATVFVTFPFISRERRAQTRKKPQPLWVQAHLRFSGKLLCRISAGHCCTALSYVRRVQWASSVRYPFYRDI